jgi:DNA-binding XRE family transcriptional regulator
MGIISRGFISIKNSRWDMAKPSPSHAGKPVLVSLGKKIREIRMKKGVSQESVALASGLDRSYFGGIERGEHNVAIANLEKIAVALGINMSELFK